MNQLFQYDPYMGQGQAPAYGPAPSNNVLDNLFQTLTRQQIMAAFGHNPGLLDQLMNAPQGAPTAWQPSPMPAPQGAVQEPAAPAAEQSYQQSIERGGDGYSPFGNDTLGGPSVVSYGPNERGGWDVTNSAGVTTTTHANGAQTTSGGEGGGGK